ncbi:protein PLASTID TRANSCRIPTIONALLY ACTIVE 16, chloroplastic [Corylus avellana]|uniref:protein PLASTID TRANSCRIPTIONALLY ACTIVE 16, chloroplastic n=1 Tax=Corylus avellana TaxID=13451 RepID=UPI001E21D880|nr:protein PLASTID TRANSCRIPTIONALLY ACTIVE 16, chloroplastic [Corylus avellana]
MAPTLTSNSFILTPSPHSSRLILKNTRLTIFAKQAGPFPSLRFGKSNDSSAGEPQPDDSANGNPFRFDFGKIPDVKSLIPAVSNPSSGLSRRKDPSTVFVAGATGQAGIRIAQTLLRQGFSVRAGVPELGSAQELARLAAKYKIISNEDLKRLNAVESTFQGAESIAKAIGNASKVVVTIGPAENGPTSVVSTSDALQVINAAQLAGVGHVAIIYDGNPAGASTYNVLDGISSFFGNLFSGSQPLSVPEFLQKVVETDVGYTFIKTNLTEDFSPESSYNVVVSAERSPGANDYKVAKSKIASLVADVFSNTAVAENKVVEVFTNPSAPSRRVVELFSAIPEDGRRKAYAESRAKAKAEEEALEAAEKARAAAEATKKLEKEVKKLSEQEARATSLAEEAQEKAEVAGASVETLLNKAKDFGSGLSWEKLSSQVSTAVQNSAEKPKVQVATVRGQAKARSLQPKNAVVNKQPSFKLPSFKPKEEPLQPKNAVVNKQPSFKLPSFKPKEEPLQPKNAVVNKQPSFKLPSFKPKEEPKPKPKGKQQTEEKPEVRKVFGGLFSQETIYVDDE